MFAFVEGLLDELNIDSCVVDVGGFGVNVGISGRTALLLPGIGEHVKLYTYTSVREDGISLYGFSILSHIYICTLILIINRIPVQPTDGDFSFFCPSELSLLVENRESQYLFICF